METRSHRKPAEAVGGFSSGSVPGTRPSGISFVEENLWKPGGASTSTLQSGRVSVTHAPSDFYTRKSGFYPRFNMWGVNPTQAGRSFGSKGRSPRPEGPRAGVGFLGRGQRAPSPTARGLGECCKLPQRGPGQSPGKFEIWCNLRPQKSLQLAMRIYSSLELSRQII